MGALVEQGCVGSVEVLRRPRAGVVVVGGVAAPDEAQDLPVGVGDGQHDAVAEPVDEPTAGRGRGESGGEQFGIGDAAAAQVVDQGGPLVRVRFPRKCGGISYKG